MKSKDDSILENVTKEQIEVLKKMNLKDICLIKQLKLEDILKLRKLNVEAIDLYEHPYPKDQLDHPYSSVQLDHPYSSAQLDQLKSQSSSDQQITLDHFPDLTLEKILGFLSFHEIAKARIVCHSFNNVCKKLLNQGFSSAKIYYKKCEKWTEKEFPTEYKNNYLPKNLCCDLRRDILHIIDASLLLLDLTYFLCIKSNRCCFIPGKILDKIYRMYHRIMSRDRISERNLKLICDKKAIKYTSLMAINHFICEILPLHKDSWISPGILFTPNAKRIDEIVVQSFTGSLTLDKIELTSNKLFIYSNRNILSSLRGQFQTAIIKKERQPNGLERGLEPEKILMTTYFHDILNGYHLIKWKGENEAEFVNSKLLSTNKVIRILIRQS